MAYGIKACSCHPLSFTHGVNFPNKSRLHPKVKMSWEIQKSDITIKWPKGSRESWPTPGGGYSNSFLTGCAARSLKPLPKSKDFSPSKNGWFNGFFEIFANRDPFLRVFLPHWRADFTIFLWFLWTLTLFPGFSWPKFDPCLRIYAEQVTHLGGTSPYALTCEYPPRVTDMYWTTMYLRSLVLSPMYHRSNDKISRRKESMEYFTVNLNSDRAVL